MQGCSPTRHSTISSGVRAPRSLRCVRRAPQPASRRTGPPCTGLRNPEILGLAEPQAGAAPRQIVFSLGLGSRPPGYPGSRTPGHSPEEAEDGVAGGRPQMRGRPQLSTAFGTTPWHTSQRLSPERRVALPPCALRPAAASVRQRCPGGGTAGRGGGGRGSVCGQSRPRCRRG